MSSRRGQGPDQDNDGFSRTNAQRIEEPAPHLTIHSTIDVLIDSGISKSRERLRSELEKSRRAQLEHEKYLQEAQSDQERALENLRRDIIQVAKDLVSSHPIEPLNPHATAEAEAPHEASPANQQESPQRSITASPTLVSKVLQNLDRNESLASRASRPPPPHTPNNIAQDHAKLYCGTHIPQRRSRSISPSIKIEQSEVELIPSWVAYGPATSNASIASGAAKRHIEEATREVAEKRIRLANTTNDDAAQFGFNAVPTNNRADGNGYQGYQNSIKNEVNRAPPQAHSLSHSAVRPSLIHRNFIHISSEWIRPNSSDVRHLDRMFGRNHPLAVDFDNTGYFIIWPGNERGAKSAGRAFRGQLSKMPRGPEFMRKLIGLDLFGPQYAIIDTYRPANSRYR